MNALSSLEEIGLTVNNTVDGNIWLVGLESLPVGKGQFAIALAMENKCSLLEELKQRDLVRQQVIPQKPTQEQVAHAHSLLVLCPVKKQSIHCWHCSRCSVSHECLAKRSLSREVDFFIQSEKPYSLYLIEQGSVKF